ncbi:hypothetical protein MTO96_045276 [Rhipicephalus appendiculatus]
MLTSVYMQHEEIEALLDSRGNPMMEERLEFPLVLPPRFQQQYRFLRDATYENARKKISKSEYTSSLSIDPDHPPEKRRRRPPAKWTDDDLPQIMPSAERASAAVPAVPDDFPKADDAASQSQNSFCAVSIDNIPDNGEINHPKQAFH